MATIDIVVLKHHKKGDGTFNIKYRLSHLKKHKYIPTNFFITQKGLDKKMNVKDANVLLALEPKLTKYRQRIGELSNIVTMDVDQLWSRINTDDSEPIDFLQFAKEHVSLLRERGKTGSASNLNTVLASLIDYFQSESMDIVHINYKMLVDYENYLTKERTLERKRRDGRSYIRKVEPMSASGLSNHMRDLRVLFNACRDMYNDEDAGILRVKHYPFKKYKVQKPPITAKRNLSVALIRKIRDCQPATQNGIFARDMFMLSFYLCGMNSADFYAMQSMPSQRVEYNRGKTKGKRRDGAFISIKLVEQAEPLLASYMSRKKHSTLSGQNHALNKGLKEVSKLIGVDPITFYYARHSFATIARNDCRISKYDIAMALNHVDEGFNVTDTYLEKDWTIIDDVQATVVALLGKA